MGIRETTIAVWLGAGFIFVAIIGLMIFGAYFG